MSETSRIAVGKKVSGGWVALGILVALGTLGGGGFLVADGTAGPGWTLIALGLLLLALTIGWWISVASRWRDIEIGDGEFRVYDRGGVSEYADEEVVCLSLRRKRNFSNGDLKSVTRTLDLWVADESSPRGMSLVQLVNTILVGQSDPLADFIDRIAKHLHQRAKTELGLGKPVDGEGWTIERGTLYLAQKSNSREIPLRDVQSCSLVDDCVCMWIGEEESPSVRIPVTASNSYILQILIDEELSQRPEKPTEDTGGLGRIIFERPPGSGYTVAFWLLAVLAVLAAILGVVGYFSPIHSPSTALGMGLGIAVVLGLCAFGVRWSSVSLRCHERGVSLVGPSQRKEIRYVDVDSFTWSATRVFVNGAYSGTTLQIRFVSRPGELPPQTIKYNRSVNVIDDELDNLRDHISSVVASKMYERFLRGEEIVWTPTMVIAPDGLRHRPSGFLGKKAEVLVPYTDIANFNIDEGFYRIWRTQDKKSSVNEAVSQDNFFPGFYLFCRVMDDLWKAKEQSVASPQQN